MKNKYGNKKVEVDGIKFDSKAEAKMYRQLKELELSNDIEDLIIHPKYELFPKLKLRDGTTQRAISYSADFQFYDNRQKRLRVVDCKGWKTQMYALRKKLFNYVFADSGLVLEETI